MLSQGMEEVFMSTNSVREAAQRIIEQLPEDATWEDVLYQIYVRQSIEAGLADCRVGRLLAIDGVKKQLGLPT